MKRKRRITALVGGAIVLLVVGKIMFLPQPKSIDGVWKNDYYGACMCSSENFFLFEGGKITLYSDTHFTTYGEGDYEDLGGGKYRVTLHDLEYPGSVWDVQPRATWWMHPPDKNRGLFRWRSRLFYRPDDGIDRQDLISTAEQRDARLKEAIAKHKANKPE